MTPALPVIKPKDCLRALERAGFYIDHRTGSHARLFHRTDPKRKVTLPR
ncbi:MAG: type II toxin-antitoxin system HicA family toxin [Acidobacteriota bacterium]